MDGASSTDSSYIDFGAPKADSILNSDLNSGRKFALSDYISGSKTSKWLTESPINAISFGEDNVYPLFNWAHKVVLDPTVTKMGIPKEAYYEIIHLIKKYDLLNEITDVNGTLQVARDCTVSNLPSLFVRIGSAYLEIMGSDYVVKNSSGVCELAIEPIN